METHELLHTPPTRLGGLEALTVVVGEHPMPAWVARWCRRADRPLRVRSARDPLDRIELIAALAGSSILVPYPDGSATSARVRSSRPCVISRMATRSWWRQRPLPKCSAVR